MKFLSLLLFNSITLLSQSGYDIAKQLTKNIVFDDEIAKDAAITINGELSEKFKN